MKTILFYLIGMLCLAQSCTNKNQAEFPSANFFAFGSSLHETKRNIELNSDSINIRLNEPIQLPTATQNQSQMDVYGFNIGGKPRSLEFVFADDQLDIVWVLTEANEEEKLTQDFIERYGTPSHKTSETIFFINDRVAIRNKPHEVLYISDRLVDPYKKFLSSHKNQTQQ